MRAVCLRCGIDVSEYGRVCKDCVSVDPRFSTTLREAAEAKIASIRKADRRLRGITYVGNTSATRSRRKGGD